MVPGLLAMCLLGGAAFSPLPLAFEENGGVVDARVRYFAHARGADLFLTRDAAVFAVRDSASTRASFALQLAGARPSAPAALKPLGAVANHLVGNQPSSWRAGVPLYSEVAYP